MTSVDQSRRRSLNLTHFRSDKLTHPFMAFSFQAAGSWIISYLQMRDMQTFMRMNWVNSVSRAEGGAI
jgi:hypothetical protein